MVTLPPEFTATKFPGYFWNIEDKQLYSIKVGGVLKPLKKKRLFDTKSIWSKHEGLEMLFNRGCRHYYHVSVKGNRIMVTDLYLNTLSQTDSVIPVVKK